MVTLFVAEKDMADGGLRRDSAEQSTEDEGDAAEPSGDDAAGDGLAVGADFKDAVAAERNRLHASKITGSEEDFALSGSHPPRGGFSLR